MNKPIRIIQYGLGAIGQAAARLVLDRKGLQLVGAVDRDPKLIGRDLGDLLGRNRKLGFEVSDKLGEADVVIHCSTSKFEECAAQNGRDRPRRNALRQLLRGGVVSLLPASRARREIE